MLAQPVPQHVCTVHELFSRIAYWRSQCHEKALISSELCVEWIVATNWGWILNRGPLKDLMHSQNKFSQLLWELTCREDIFLVPIVSVRNDLALLR